MKNTVADFLWGKQSRYLYLSLAALLLLLTALGSREIWTQEHRWADIVLGMFYRQDFLHPYLGETNYYDKPLLSYWLIAGVAFLQGELTSWALRLPSALAGLLSIWSIYQIGRGLYSREVGLLAGWMLLTTFYFIFWARTSSADMLNMAGSLFATYWYLDKKHQPSLRNYSIFFLIIAFTSLCKGLVGAVVPLIAILPDLLHKQQWKSHLRMSFFVAMLPAAILYVLPFWASSHFGGETYQENGLYLVYRENILRFFQPFDHKGPLYTYFLFLPIYLLPWLVFFVPALCSLPARWRKVSFNTKWMAWAVFLLFTFFTLSGSRRNYYILPVIPYAILLTAEWISSATENVLQRNRWAGRVTLSSFIIFFLLFDVIQPLYYSQGGVKEFSSRLKVEASQKHPWAYWHIVLLDAESKLSFYLALPPHTEKYVGSEVRGLLCSDPNALLRDLPILKQPEKNMLFISRKQCQAAIERILPGYRVISAKETLGERWFKGKEQDRAIAFIPKD